MDSDDQEKERGITILAKNCAVFYKDKRINLVDTPGHADFGGEVERIMNMVDGVLLVVDSVDGPKPQTRFVLKKALEKGLKAIVVVNKIDRPSARPEYVVDKTFDLFAELDADDDQMDFKVVYASGMNGISGLDHTDIGPDLLPLFDEILNLPEPSVDESKALQVSKNYAKSRIFHSLIISSISSSILLNRIPNDTHLLLLSICAPVAFMSR